MKKISFAYLDDYEKILLKSIIKILDKKKQFTIVENHDSDSERKIIFVNFNDRRGKMLVDSEEGHQDFIILHSPNKIIIDNSYKEKFNAVDRPFNAQKVASALAKFKPEPSEIKIPHHSWREILEADKTHNLLITEQDNVCLIVNNKKEIYYDVKNGSFDQWINESSNINIKEVSQDTCALIQKYNLTNAFTYDAFYYLLYFHEYNDKIFEHTRVKLVRFPNLFPQADLYQEIYKDFYHLCFYLSRKKITPGILAINLNIHKNIVMQSIFALYKLGFIEIEQDTEKTEIKPSKVKSIFSKIKSALGM